MSEDKRTWTKLRIATDGYPGGKTKIEAVDPDGATMMLDLVDDIEFRFLADRPAKFRLGFCFGNDLEIEVPAKGNALARIIDRSSAWERLHRAVRNVPDDGIVGGAPDWLVELYRAASAASIPEVDK